MTKKYISNKDESARLFGNNLLESLSKVHWSVPLFVFVPIILTLLYWGVAEFQLDTKSVIIYFIFGLVVWTFTEYTLHRFLFHFNFKSDFGKRIHFLIHGVHHDYPNDSKRLVMPPAVSLPLAAFFWFLFIYIFGVEINSILFSGFLAGYIFYDMTHYAVHHYNFRSKFWIAIKNHHFLHHYKNSQKGYGVSQPTWDYVFGTSFKEEKGGKEVR
ncbi:MAG: sterol desaturase family protein [Ignavibacteriales bacterium]|nr:sterol desaturase family protein [Ignavibacteriales bacterium]